MTDDTIPASTIPFAQPPNPAVTSARNFRAIDEGHYRFTLLEVGVQLDIDRLRRERHELIGELTVLCDWPGARTVEGTLSAADFNLSSARARQDRGKLLAERAQSDGFDWAGVLEELCQRILKAERVGQPAVHLRDLARPTPDEDFEVDGLRLLRRHPVIWFGDGGTAKSLLALHAAGHLVRRGLRVLFADWEFSAEDHRARLEDLFGIPMPDVLYVRCDRPLVYEQDRLRRVVRDERIHFIVVDSIAFACEGPPEAAEGAAGFYRALRTLGTGSLLIAHINKSEAGDQKPFGSTFWHNGARATWFVQREHADTAAGDGKSLTIGLFHRKANTGPLRPGVGFELSFGPQGTTVRRVDLNEVSDLAARLPLWQRIASVLRTGPMSIEAIAEETGKTPDTVRKTVNRSQGRTFIRVPGSDGVSRIALVERRTA